MKIALKLATLFLFTIVAITSHSAGTNTNPLNSQSSESIYSYSYFSSEEALKAYIDGYLESNMLKVISTDNYFFSEIHNKLTGVPQEYKKAEETKAIKNKLQELRSFESINKADGSFTFNNPIRFDARGGHWLYSILYPKMKYRIMEVKDEAAFLEVIYDSPEKAPTDLVGNKSVKIKKAVVKISFSKWTVGKSSSTPKSVFKVGYYEPTGYGLEYFQSNDMVRQKPPTPAPSSSPNASLIEDPCNEIFCGIWEYDRNGSKEYFKISKAKNNRFKFVTGYKYEGKIVWLHDIMLKNADGIYLTPSDGKLKGQFVSGNFYATHGQDFTYKIAIEIKSDNKLLYSVHSSIRGETDVHEAIKVDTKAKTDIHPFTGTWKPNLSKSKLLQKGTIPIIRFEVLEKAVILTATNVTVNGQPDTKKLHPDGKEYPLPELPGAVQVVKWIDSRTLEMVVKSNEKVQAEITWQVSMNGKTLIQEIKETDASGAQSKTVIVFDRQ
jgi:hypothetical protein